MKERSEDKLPEELRTALLNIPYAGHLDPAALRIIKGATASLTLKQAIIVLDYRDTKPANGHPIQLRGRGVGSNY